MNPRPAILATALLLACSGQGTESAPPSAQDLLSQTAAAKSLPPEKFVSTTAGFDLELPGIWRGRYRAEEHTDTTAGARLRVDFKFVPDSGSKAPSLTLMTLRVLPKSAWDVASKKPGAPIGSRLGANAKDVFLLSLPGSNPYPPASPEAPIFDRLIISLSQGGQQVHLTPR